MGEPAVVTPEERERTYELSDQIVEAVRDDECGPCDIPFEMRARIPDDVNAWAAENEERIFDLAAEVVLLRTERFDLRTALNEALDEWDGGDEAMHHERGVGAYVPPPRIAELRQTDIPPEPVFLVVWKDRHVDVAITVHLSRSSADAKLAAYMEDNADEEYPWKVVDYKPATGAIGEVNWRLGFDRWVRSVISDNDDGPKGHIERAKVSR